MEMLIAVVFAGFLTLILIRFFFPDNPDNGSLFQIQEHLKKINTQFKSKKKKKKMAQTMSKKPNVIVSNGKKPPLPPREYPTAYKDRNIIITDLAIENNGIIFVNLDRFSWQEIETNGNRNILGKKKESYWQKPPVFTRINPQDSHALKTKRILQSLIGTKDLVSGEILKPGQRVYVCLSCQLGYHEDSWYYLNRVCEQCKGDEKQIKSHILPASIRQNRQTPQTKKKPLSKFSYPETKKNTDRKNYSFKKTIKE
jgi:hypothetical protein